MTRTEAEYWLFRLREALRIIACTNIKAISLLDENGKYLASIEETSRDFPLRQTNFPDDEYVDRRQIRRINVCGYLPIKVEDSDYLHAIRSSFYHCVEFKVNVLFWIFRRYIEDFMHESFDLDVHWNDFENKDAECLSIPVHPREKQSFGRKSCEVA